MHAHTAEFGFPGQEGAQRLDIQHHGHVPLLDHPVVAEHGDGGGAGPLADDVEHIGREKLDIGDLRRGRRDGLRRAVQAPLAAARSLGQRLALVRHGGQMGRVGGVVCQHRTGLGGQGLRPLPPLGQRVEPCGTLGTVRRQSVHTHGPAPRTPRGPPRGLGKVDPQGLQRTVLAPLVCHALDERVAVVGQQQELFRDPAELDMEQLAVGPDARVQHRDRRPRRPVLRRMHGRTVGMIRMTQLRVGERETELPAALAEAHPPVSDLHDLRLAAVDQVRSRGCLPRAGGALRLRVQRIWSPSRSSIRSMSQTLR